MTGLTARTNLDYLKQSYSKLDFFTYQLIFKALKINIRLKLQITHLKGKNTTN